MRLLQVRGVAGCSETVWERRIGGRCASGRVEGVEIGLARTRRERAVGASAGCRLARENNGGCFRAYTWRGAAVAVAALLQACWWWCCSRRRIFFMRCLALIAHCRSALARDRRYTRVQSLERRRGCDHRALAQSWGPRLRVHPCISLYNTRAVFWLRLPPSCRPPRPFHSRTQPSPYKRRASRPRTLLHRSLPRAAAVLVLTTTTGARACR